MPTKRRRRGTAWRAPEFSRDRREHLLIGHALLGIGYGHDRVDLEAAAADWEVHRGELMAFWTQDPAAWHRENRAGFYNPAPGGPGTRPAAWWWFDVPGDERLAFGIAPVNKEAHRVMGAPHVCGVLVEAQAAFLRRHGLLLPGELARIPVSAFEPVVVFRPEEAKVDQLERLTSGDPRMTAVAGDEGENP